MIEQPIIAGLYFSSHIPGGAAWRRNHNEGFLLAVSIERAELARKTAHSTTEQESWDWVSRYGYCRQNCFRPIIHVAARKKNSSNTVTMFQWEIVDFLSVFFFVPS